MYIDPGTGTVILQAIIGAVAIALVSLRFYWDRVKQFITRKNTPKNGDNNGK